MKERIKGVLLGGAVGDAMGMPTEFFSRRKIKEKYGKVETFLSGSPDSVISKGFKAGETTDDTANSMMVSEMLIESNGEISPELYLKKLKEWSKSSGKSALVTGPSTQRAISMIERGIPIEEAGKLGTTNGAAMKVAPLGVLCDYQDLEDLVNRVHLLCMPTHNTGVAIGGAAAVAAIISYVITGGKDWNEIWNLAFRAIERGSAEGFDYPIPSLRKRLELARSIVDSRKNDESALSDLYEIVGTGVATIESVPSAVAIAYMVQGDPAKCASYCASIGGDTDTIGAIACGICGGINPSFPKETLELIEKVNSYDFDAIAEKLWICKMNRGKKVKMTDLK